MGLKQSIVIVNEFTVKGKSGQGSRGSTPGDYVLRYMGRNGASEDLTPVRFDSEAYVERYMLRKEAVDTGESISGIKEEMRNIQGLGGLGFGYGEVSLSHQSLKRASKDIQKQFDAGKTVMKTVLSFDEEYLRDNKIIDQGFTCEKCGDYRGNIDQMKLRMAIMNGMEKLSKDYDDLQYVGVIQVDTMHVHCHLAMVDRGKGRRSTAGTQNGRITERGKRILRRGIDSFLDEKQSVKLMSSNVQQDKRNTLCFIKKYTHEMMDEHGTPQFLLACLPKDKRLWRAGTNRKDMQKANQLVRDLVSDILAEPDSGYREALHSIEKYAVTRQMREGLSEEETHLLYQRGQKQLFEDCMNGVYAVLRQIPDEERTVQTPMMMAMSMDYETMAAKQQEDPMIEFGFRLRSYSSRLTHHREERKVYRTAVQSYEQAEEKSEESKPLYAFFKFEENYHARLMSKYHHFLSFLPPTEEYEDGFHELMHYKHRIQNLKKLRADPSPRRMKAEHAEEYGVKVFGEHGGKYLTFAPDIIDRRITRMEDTYQMMEEDFKYQLSQWGMSLDETGVSKQTPYAFSEVKALDLHHLSYDFPEDFPISKSNLDIFTEAADERYRLYQNAKLYLMSSGQEAAISQLPEVDIRIMKDFADRMRVNPVMKVVHPEAKEFLRKGKTVSLDMDYTQNINETVKSIVQDRQFGED